MSNGGLEIDLCASRRIESQSIVIVCWWKEVYMLLISRYKWVFLKDNKVTTDPNSILSAKDFNVSLPHSYTMPAKIASCFGNI